MTDERIFTNLRTFLEHILEKELVGKTISPSGTPPKNWPKNVVEGQIKRVNYYPKTINLEVMFKDDRVYIFDIGLPDFEDYKVF